MPEGCRKAWPCENPRHPDMMDQSFLQSHQAEEWHLESPQPWSRRIFVEHQELISQPVCRLAEGGSRGECLAVAGFFHPNQSGRGSPI